MPGDRRRTRLIRWDERIQFPDDEAPQAAMDFPVRHSFLRRTTITIGSGTIEIK
jgi:hypothetical protein